MNDFTEFEIAVGRHFTASELIEFLGIDMDMIFDRFEDEIWERFDELCEEIGYEYDPEV